MITAVPGVRVGHWTGARTGCTVVLLPAGTVGAAEVRGGSPATREVMLLDPVRTVEQVDAVLLTGGSAFGLAAADGVMGPLAAAGRGVPTAAGPVPIVPTVAIFDLVGPDARPPGPAEGAAALAAATDGGFLVGAVGAGRGARVGRWRGTEHAVPGGLGSAHTGVDGACLGALAVVNSVGDVVDVDGTVLAGSSAPPGTPAFPEPLAPMEQTTLVVVATDARLSKRECFLVAQSAHHGLVRSIHPSHTRFDGDLAVAVSTGVVEGVSLERLRLTTTEVVAEAVRDAVRAGGTR
jgi:L-aminopeptidase/D-esterase-like protein